MTQNARLALYIPTTDDADPAEVVTATGVSGAGKVIPTAFNKPSGGLGEAPMDGRQYARKDAAWDVVAPSGGGGSGGLEPAWTMLAAAADPDTDPGAGNLTLAADYMNTQSLTFSGIGAGGEDFLSLVQTLVPGDEIVMRAQDSSSVATIRYSVMGDFEGDTYAKVPVQYVNGWLPSVDAYCEVSFNFVNKLLTVYLPTDGSAPMTGNLTLHSDFPSVNFEYALGGAAGIGSGNENGPRWMILLSNFDGESGGDTGSNFDIRCFSDDGEVSHIPLAISRATGLAVVEADPVDALGIATKQYVDANAGGGGGSLPAIIDGGVF